MADDVLQDAREYFHEHGLTVLPMRYGTKEPIIKWAELRRRPATEAEIESWFGKGRRLNIAVVTGAVSSNVIVRDFDGEAGLADYRRFKREFPVLAAQLPTVQTGRGVHLYFRGNLSKTQYLPDGRGELRGNGDLCILPRSLHPNGKTYTSIVPFRKDNLIELDYVRLGLGLPDTPTLECLTECTETTEGTESTERTEEIVAGKGIDPEIDEIINRTLPVEYGQRHRKLFELARTLRSSPRFSDANVKDLRFIVAEWHRRAMPKIRTKDFTTSWCDFVLAYPKVKYLLGQDPMTQIFSRATKAKLPKVAERYRGNSTFQLLISLCLELQRVAGDEPIYLSSRKAGELLGISHVQASQYLYLLRVDGILREVTKGGTAENPRRATRYRYVGGA